MSELTRRDFQCLLDEVAKAIGKYPFDYTYTDLPKQVKAECERLTKIIDDNNAVTKQWVDEAKSTLPEPDATNPDHLRWTAKMIETARPGGDDEIRGRQWNVLADKLRAEADRLDAARAAEREREKRIAEAARVLADFTLTSDLDRAARALEDAGLLRGGVR